MTHTQWPLLWLVSNLLTGMSYVVIAGIVWRERDIRVDHWLLFALFVCACGLHHLVHAIPGEPFWLDMLQMFTDAMMTGISVFTAVLTVIAHRKGGVSWTPR